MFNFNVWSVTNIIIRSNVVSWQQCMKVIIMSLWICVESFEWIASLNTLGDDKELTCSR